MKRKSKNLFCILLLLLCIVGSNVVSYAAMTPFNITIPNDTLSPRIPKGTDGEQRFYVTGYTFDNPIGELICTSLNWYDSGICSDPAVIYQNKPRGNAIYPKNNAIPGSQYYMLTYSTNATNFNVTGVYNP